MAIKDALATSFASPALEDGGQGILVVVTSDTPLDLSAFEDDALLPQKRLSDAALDELLSVMLTDRYAPVEQMLAPVFLEKTVDEE
jgi:hypothetical protein